MVIIVRYFIIHIQSMQDHLNKGEFMQIKCRFCKQFIKINFLRILYINKCPQCHQLLIPKRNKVWNVTVGISVIVAIVIVNYVYYKMHNNIKVSVFIIGCVIWKGLDLVRRYYYLKK